MPPALLFEVGSLLGQPFAKQAWYSWNPPVSTFISISLTLELQDCVVIPGFLHRVLTQVHVHVQQALRTLSCFPQPRSLILNKAYENYEEICMDRQGSLLQLKNKQTNS